MNAAFEVGESETTTRIVPSGTVQGTPSVIGARQCVKAVVENSFKTVNRSPFAIATISVLLLKSLRAYRFAATKRSGQRITPTISLSIFNALSDLALVQQRENHRFPRTNGYGKVRVILFSPAGLPVSALNLIRPDEIVCILVKP